MCVYWHRRCFPTLAIALLMFGLHQRCRRRVARCPGSEDAGVSDSGTTAVSAYLDNATAPCSWLRCSQRRAAHRHNLATPGKLKHPPRKDEGARGPNHAAVANGPADDHDQPHPGDLELRTTPSPRAKSISSSAHRCTPGSALSRRRGRRHDRQGQDSDRSGDGGGGSRNLAAHRRRGRARPSVWLRQDPSEALRRCMPGCRRCPRRVGLTGEAFYGRQSHELREGNNPFAVSGSVTASLYGVNVGPFGGFIGCTSGKDAAPTKRFVVLHPSDVCFVILRLSAATSRSASCRHHAAEIGKRADLGERGRGLHIQTLRAPIPATCAGRACCAR